MATQLEAKPRLRVHWHSKSLTRTDVRHVLARRGAITHGDVLTAMACAGTTDRGHDRATMKPRRSV